MHAQNIYILPEGTRLWFGGYRGKRIPQIHFWDLICKVGGKIGVCRLPRLKTLIFWLKSATLLMEDHIKLYISVSPYSILSSYFFTAIIILPKGEKIKKTFFFINCSCVRGHGLWLVTEGKQMYIVHCAMCVEPSDQMHLCI